MYDIQERIETHTKNGVEYIKTTGYYLDGDGNEIVKYEIDEEKISTSENIEELNDSEQASIDAAINTEYLVCMAELNMTI